MGMALEDAHLGNGCLQAIKGAHKLPLKKRFKRSSQGGTQMEVLDDTPWPAHKLAVLEVPKGTLVILHGQLPHLSAANTSGHSREALSIHMIDESCEYPPDNWLRSSL